MKASPDCPDWLDLPRGVRVEIRPVTTAVMAAAQAGSARRLGALRAATEDLDPDMARGRPGQRPEPFIVRNSLSMTPLVCGSPTKA